MANQVTYESRVFSPRWGHEDTYSIRLNEDEIEISIIGKTAKCTRRENLDPLWTGHLAATGNPLVKILENDHIYPPSVFIRALEFAWQAWCDGTLDDSQVVNEIEALFAWLNPITENRPKSDFWMRTF